MSTEENKLSHIDESGAASMVDIGNKVETQRTAKALGFVKMKPGTLELIKDGKMPKGDVFSVARIAGIQAAKNTSQLIPLCHPLMLNKVDITFKFDTDKSGVEIFSVCSLSGKTGVEMEALTAVSVAALTLYDMCKAVDKGISIQDICLLEKIGGKSGHWQKE